MNRWAIVLKIGLLLLLGYGSSRIPLIHKDNKKASFAKTISS
jgi:hypothetical protein